MISARLFLILVLLVDLVASAVTISMGKKPSSLMGEGEPYTYLSFAQLLAAGLLSGWIFWCRHQEEKEKQNNTDKSYHWVWLVMCAGFIFLSIDEVTQFHENLNRWMLVWFNWEKTNITDRIDDAIIGIYALIGVVFLWINRFEFPRFKGGLKFLTASVVLAFISVAMDLSGHHTDVARFFFKERSVYMPVYQWLKALEEVFKVLAEGVALSAFYYCLQHVKHINNVESEASESPAEPA